MEMETTNNEKQTLNLKGNRKNINLYNWNWNQVFVNILVQFSDDT
jgi:hypothetical protein